jgi:hypothetical protein
MRQTEKFFITPALANYLLEKVNQAKSNLQNHPA